MTISLELLKKQLDDQVAAIDTEMSDERRYEFVKKAVERYNHDRPDQYTENVTGDGGRFYVIPTILANWIEGFSQIIEIEYPAAAVASDETPQWLDPEDWQDDYWAEVGETPVHTRHLYLPAHAPGSTETMRIRYTVPYVWEVGGSEVSVAQASHGLAVGDYIYLSDSSWIKTQDNTATRATARVTVVTDTGNFKYKTLWIDIPTQDFFAICDLASCFTLQSLAAKYARASDSTIGADSTTHTSRTAELAQRASGYCKSYRIHLNLDAEEVHQAAGEFVDWDTAPPLASRRRWIFHND